MDCHRNLNVLAIEMYKIFNDQSSKSMKNLVEEMDTMKYLVEEIDVKHCTRSSYTIEKHDNRSA